jgi:hypothetical protein
LHPHAGPERIGASGKPEKWDRSGDFAEVSVPTPVIGDEHNTMDPKNIEWISKQLLKGDRLSPSPVRSSTVAVRPFSVTRSTEMTVRFATHCRFSP